MISDLLPDCCDHTPGRRKANFHPDSGVRELRTSDRNGLDIHSDLAMPGQRRNSADPVSPWKELYEQAPVAGKNVLYTTDADFDQGVLQDVNHDAPNNNQLQLNKTSAFFPFGYNTCADRDNDGLIATSRGQGDIRPWTNAGGADNGGGVTTAADECLINYTRVNGTNTRTISTQANPADLPCVDDHANLATVTLSAGILTVRANALDTRTEHTPDNLAAFPPTAGDNATSTAQVESTRISSLLVNIELGVIQTTASATCVAGPGGLVPSFSGSSSIASLKINGVTIPVGTAPVTIPLVIGSLRLNSTTTTATTVVQQAVVLDTLLTDVVVGEAKANVEATAGNPGGHPCHV